MSKVDGRKIPHEVREKIRFNAIQEWLDGLSVTQLAAKYGTSRKIVYQWIERYDEGGFDALKTKTGHGRGKASKLTDEQKNQVSLILRTKTPEDYGYQTVLWTRTIVAQLIAEFFDVSYAPATVGKILRKLGFTPQKPRWGAWQQDPKKRQSAISSHFKAG